jgi:hypothetical protein
MAIDVLITLDLSFEADFAVDFLDCGCEEFNRVGDVV